MKQHKDRREFLITGSKLAAAAMLSHMGAFAASAAAGIPEDRSCAGIVAPGETVMTVTGKIPASALGFTLSHEHVMVDFIGAAEVSRSRYKMQEVFDKALPYMQAVKNAGCKTFADCTPAWLGRDAALLKMLSEKAGMNIITNTGYYGASKEKYIPAHAYSETAEQLAERWISEFRDGIDNTGIRPGFIKTGVDSAPLTQHQQKLIRAAAITHLATGLTIFVHTNGGKAALEEMKILEQNGVSPEAWNWVHAQAEKDRSFHLQVARAGGWVSFDGFHPEAIDQYLIFLTDMKQAALLHRVLLSHDAGWYNVGEKDGGIYRGHNAIAETLLPALRKKGFDEKEIRLLFHENPARLFSIRKRPKKIIA